LPEVVLSGSFVAVALVRSSLPDVVVLVSVSSRASSSSSSPLPGPLFEPLLLLFVTTGALLSSPMAVDAQ
jgi:hypothetical protein